MTRRVTVLPADGRRVRLPDGRLLAAGGIEVLVTSYWIRRRVAGDVVFSKGRRPAVKSSGGKEQP